MALAHSPSIVTSGLVLCLDAANPKSYPGSGTVLNDISGNGNGALATSVTYNSANLGFFQFNGTDRFWAGNLTSPAVGSSITIEAVINLSDVAGTKAIFSHGRSGTSFACGMIINGTSMRFRNSTNDYALSSPTTLTTGQWYHLVLSTTSLGTTGYCNGTSQGTTAQTITTNSITDYHIGRRSSNVASEFMNGNIAYVRVYHNKALSEAEVQQNFNAIRGRYGI